MTSFLFLVFISFISYVVAQSGQVPFDEGAQPIPTKPNGDPREYRSCSGRGNNIANPTWGAANTPYEWDGLTPTFYQGAGSTGTYELEPYAPVGRRVNEREVSVRLAKAAHRGQDLVPNLLSQMHTEWGHFMTCDLVSTVETRGNTAASNPPYPLYDYVPVYTNVGDDAIDREGWCPPLNPSVTNPNVSYPNPPCRLPTYNSTNHQVAAGGPYYIQITKYQPAAGTGEIGPGVRRVTNSVSHFVDASMIYGVDDDVNGQCANDRLWNNQTAYLHINRPFLVPSGVAIVATEPELNWITAGDGRANKNPALRFFTVLYQMEHNRRVKELRRQNPHWSPYHLFQEARKFVIGHIQATTMREYLGSTLGNPLDPYVGYNDTINPTLPVWFPIVFRYGHTEAVATTPRLKSDGVNSCDGGTLLLRDYVFLPTRWLTSDPHVLTNEEMNCFIRGFSLTLAGKVDAGFVDDIRNFLIGGARHGSDLLVFALYRSAELGLPDYQAVRERYGLPRVRSYKAITSDVAVQKALETLYGPISRARIHAFIGAVSEDHVPGASVGPLIRASMLDIFTKLRDGDRFWYQNLEAGTYTQEDVDEIHGVKLRDLMVTNFGLGETEIPTSAFFVERRQLDRPVSGNEAFLFPPLRNHSSGLEWYTQLLAPFYQLSWAIERHDGPHRITFQIQTSTEGWVGIGWKSDPNTMKNADIVLCRFINPALGQAECRDSKALEVGEPALDSTIGGSNNVQLEHYHQENGFTTVVFSRLVDTGDFRDWPITDELKTIFAFNPETNELRYHGPTRSSDTIIDYLSLYRGPPTQIYISLGIRIWLWVSAGIGVIQALLIMILIVVKKDYFHFQTPEFCVLICLGAIMGHVATLLILINNPTDGMCWANLWLFGMSFWFVFTCLFAKVARIWWTVQAAEKMKIQPVKIEMLLIPLLICCILEGAFQACWDGIYEVRPNVDIYTDQLTNEYTLYCAGNTWMWLGSVLVRAMFLLIGAWLALETRKMQKSLNWSREIALAMYTMALICCVLIPLGFAISNSPTLVIILKGIGYSYSYILILFIVFADTLLRIFSGKPARQLDSSAILSSNSGSMTGGSSSDVSVGIKSKSVS